MNTEPQQSTETVSERSSIRRLAVFVLRRALDVLLGLVILSAAVVGFLQTETGRKLLTSQVLRYVNGQIHGTLTCDDVRIDVFRGVVLQQPHLRVDGTTLLQAKELRVVYDIAALVGHTTAVNSITIIKPTINLVRATDGVWNFSKLSMSTDTTPSGPSSLVLRLKEFTIENGTVNVDDRTTPKADSTTFDPMHLQLHDVDLQASTLLDFAEHDYTVVINKLTCRDVRQTPLNLRQLSAAVHITPGGVQVRALSIETLQTSCQVHADLLGVNVEQQGLTPALLKAHPLRCHVYGKRIWGPDVRFFLPFLDIRDAYAIDTDVAYSGDAVRVQNMELQSGSTVLHGSVEVTGLDGETPLFLNVSLNDSRSRYAEVQQRLRFLHLPTLPFVGTTYVRHVEMKGHPSDSLWFDIDGTDDIGQIQGQMSLDLAKAPIAYKLNAMIKRGDLSRFGPEFGYCDLNGRVNIQGQGFTLDELRGSYNIDLEKSVVSDRFVRSGVIRINAQEPGVAQIDTLLLDVTPPNGIDADEAAYDGYTRQQIGISGFIDSRPDTLHYQFHADFDGVDLQRLVKNASLPTGFSGVVDIAAQGLSLDDFIGSISASVSEFALEDRALLPFSMNLTSSIGSMGRTLKVAAPFANITIAGAYQPTELLGSFPNIAAILATTAERRMDAFVNTSNKPISYPNFNLPGIDAEFDIQLVDASPFNVFLQGVTISSRSAVKARIVSDSTQLRILADDIVISDLLVISDSSTIAADPSSLRGELLYVVENRKPVLAKIDLVAECERNLFIGKDAINKPRVILRGNDSAMQTSATLNVNSIDAHVGLTSLYRGEQVTLLIDTIAATIDKQRKLEWVALDDAVIHARNQVFDITGLRLQRSQDEIITIEGVCSLENFSNLHIRVTDFDIKDITSFVRLDPGHPITFLSGNVGELDLYVNGSWEKPVASMRIRADDVEYNHELIGSLSASIRYANRDIVGKLAIANAKIPNSPNTLAIEVRHLPIDLGLRNVPRRIVDQGVIDIDLSATQLALAAVEPFLPAVERVHGIADGKVTMRGTLPDNMELGGSAVFKNTTFLASPTNIVYRAEGNLHLEGSKLFLDTIHIRNLDRDRRGGAALASGIVTFDGLSVSRVDFNVTSKGILIMNKGTQVRNPKVFGDVVVASNGNSPIMFYGPPDAPVLSGDVDVLYADIVFPQERSATKAKYSAFVYKRSGDGASAQRSVLDTTSVLRVSDTSSSASRAQATEVVTDAIKSTTASFSDILRFNLNVYLRGRTLMTMVLGFAEILIADLEPVDVTKPLTITGRFVDNTTNMSGRIRVKEGTSTYKFYKPFSASGILDFTKGGMSDPALDLKAIFNGRRMNVQSNDPETYRVVIDISGTKRRPIARWSYYRNERKQEGDSAKVTGDALMLLLLGRTQDELTSTGQGNLVNEVNASLSAVATSALGDLLSGVGGLVQSVQMDLGSEFSQTQLTVSGQLWSDVVYRLTGQVSDFAGNSTITVTVPFTVLNNSDAMRYFNLDISRSVNNTGNITRFQRLWEIKLGARLP